MLTQIEVHLTTNHLMSPHQELNPGSIVRDKSVNHWASQTAQLQTPKFERTPGIRVFCSDYQSGWHLLVQVLHHTIICQNNQFTTKSVLAVTSIKQQLVFTHHCFVIPNVNSNSWQICIKMPMAFKDNFSTIHSLAV